MGEIAKRPSTFTYYENLRYVPITIKYLLEANPIWRLDRPRYSWIGIVQLCRKGSPQCSYGPSASQEHSIAGALHVPQQWWIWRQGGAGVSEMGVCFWVPLTLVPKEMVHRRSGDYFIAVRWLPCCSIGLRGDGGEVSEDNTCGKSGFLARKVRI